MKSPKGGDGPQEMVEALNMRDVNTPETLKVAGEVFISLCPTVSNLLSGDWVNL